MLSYIVSSSKLSWMYVWLICASKSTYLLLPISDILPLPEGKSHTAQTGVNKEKCIVRNAGQLNIQDEKGNWIFILSKHETPISTQRIHSPDRENGFQAAYRKDNSERKPCKTTASYYYEQFVHFHAQYNISKNL